MITIAEPKILFDDTKISILKTLLLDFFKNNFDPCSGFILDFKECETEEQIKDLFKEYKNEVFNRLGGDSTLQDEVDELEDDVRDLKYEIEDLEGEIKELETPFGKTLDDVYKLQFVHQYHKQYTPWELEELLKNGKQLLKYINQ